MDLYALGKDIQEIKDRLSALEGSIGSHTRATSTGDSCSLSPLGERTTLVVANHTFRDVHVRMTGDVHTGNWGPFQLNHNQDRDAESKRIDFGDKATFHVLVYRNNGGAPGDLIGEFDHGVRYNAAGRNDRLEFSIVTINNETFLNVFSIRAAARVALILWLNA